MEICLRCKKEIKCTDRYCRYCGFYVLEKGKSVFLDNCVVLNVDTVGFTAISEKYDSEEVSEVLNAIFDPIIMYIEKNGGIINQFYGDEICALVGLTGQKKMACTRAVHIAENIHALFSALSFSSIDNIALSHIVKKTKLKISMEVSPLILKPMETDGSVSFLLFGEAEERAKRGLGFAKWGEIIVGKNLTKYIEDRMFFPVAVDVKDLFLMQKIPLRKGGTKI